MRSRTGKYENGFWTVYEGTELVASFKRHDDATKFILMGEKEERCTSACNHCTHITSTVSSDKERIVTSQCCMCGQQFQDVFPNYGNNVVLASRKNHGPFVPEYDITF